MSVRVRSATRTKVEQAVASGQLLEQVAEHCDIPLELAYQLADEMELRLLEDAFCQPDREELLDQLEQERRLVNFRAAMRPEEPSELWPHIRIVMAHNLLNWEGDP